MKIGDTVMVTDILVETDLSKPGRTMGKKSIEPVECIYLGTGQRWDGEFQWEYASEDAPYDDRFWVNTKHYNVLLCQPIDIGGRYRKPLAATIAGVKTAG